MSTNPPAPIPDDPVARATDALRRAPVPDGPSPETIARTLAAVREAAQEPGPIPRPRRRFMYTMLKAAAVVLAAAGVTYFTALPPAPASAEFIEVARKLQEARTLSFRLSATMTGMPDPMNARILYKVPGFSRTEPEPAGGPISILDTEHGKALMLNPADKSAMLLEEPAQGGGGRQRRDLAAVMIEDLRRLAQKEGEPAGEKVIGEVRARGFRVKEQGQDMTVWVDPQKRLPVLVEFAGRAGNLDFRGSLADIRLDPELDDALFRLDPPAGYTLRRADANLMMTPEQAVARYLRTYTDASGGRFPARLDDFDDFRKVVSAPAKKAREAETKKEAKGLIDPRALEVAAAAAHVGAFTATMKDRWGYKADGVKPGDAKAIVFWYKPEGQDRYKVVYGDLHTGEVTAEELPKK